MKDDANRQEFSFDFSRVEEEFDTRILSYAETLKLLAEPDISLARFGDSEIKMLSEGFSIGFQRFSIELQNALRDVLSEPRENLSIGFPPVFKNEQWANMWLRLFEDTREAFKQFRSFSNTAVSRPPCFNELGESAVNGWKNVWDGKKVLVVTGQGGRFDLKSPLLSNAAEISEVYGPAINAFEDLSSIEKRIFEASRPDLILLSLGPAATVLAHRLSQEGLKALDVGHLTASYSYYKGKGLYPEKMAMINSNEADASTRPD